MSRIARGTQRQLAVDDHGSVAGSGERRQSVIGSFSQPSGTWPTSDFHTAGIGAHFRAHHLCEIQPFPLLVH